METKTEQPSVSADASAVTETKKRTAVKKRTTVKVTPKESLEREKKTQSRRSSRTMAEKKSAATENLPSEMTSANPSEKAEALLQKQKENEELASSTTPEEKKKTVSRRKTEKPIVGKSEALAEKAAEETKDLNSAEAENLVKKQVTKKESASEKPKKSLEKRSEKTPANKASTEKKSEEKAKKPAGKKSAPRKSTPKEKKTEEAKEAEVVLEQLSVEITDNVNPKKEATGVSADREKKPARSSSAKRKSDTDKGRKKDEKDIQQSEEPSSKEIVLEKTPVKEAEEEEYADPSIEERLVAMAKKAVPAFVPSFSAHEATEVVDVSGTPRDTFVFYSPSQLAAMEKEKEAVAEEKTADSITESASEEKNVPTVESSAMTRSETAGSVEIAPKKAESPSAPEKGPVEISEVVKRERSDRRSASSRRNDPHERTVMDKELARASIYSVLERLGDLERRILIEEVMKIIPLSAEERTDNHPTSLFNRVRSVVGSMLAEELSCGRIVVNDRRLSVFEKKDEKILSEEPNEVPQDLSAEKGSVSEREATLEIEIDFRSTAEDEVESEGEEDEVLTAISSREQKESGESKNSVEKTVEAPTNATQTQTPTEITPPISTPVRESSIRRTRQQRGERRLASQGASGSILLITEEELERVIMNALRRSSATKNDLLGVLKRTYVEPNRLTREEENRIYTVAGNLLQKLVNRGILQNNDGRFLQKPSQRVLNPGRTPGASFTGNVEARFITELNRQSGDFFEQFAARLLEKYFEMSNIRVDASYVVGGSDDNGIDIMLETTDWLGYKERVFVQAKKRATQPVTLKEVREFYGALCAEEGTRGVFITTSSFCMEASKMIGKLRNLIAIDKRKLFLLAEHCEVGLIRDEEGRLLLDENLFLDYEV